ncbi:hypothetical protein QBC47DRAFT_392086 [Echria macrotheca]|uniref:Uncharacterized protein n=1 Tax=Echria macrotheca TaxID=438768 RepID=A0AAJ0B3H8_9PEZI|nr:hypothetical protein QBC47DRAFT_392086 [Echria macrotheca]
MTDTQTGLARDVEQQPLDASQHGQAKNIIDEEAATYGTKRADPDLGASMEAHEQAVKDQIDGAIPTGPKRASPESGGRVMVGEEGDLHDLAAKRQP